MPRTTYSQRSLTNREASLDHQSTKKTKKKPKIHKKKFKSRHPSTKFRANKNSNKVNPLSKYKSAYSPEYTIPVHDIELSSFHSDEIGPRCSHSDDELDYNGIDQIPFAKQCSQEVFRRVRQDYERRDLERIMRGCKVSDQREYSMAE